MLQESGSLPEQGNNCEVVRVCFLTPCIEVSHVLKQRWVSVRTGLNASVQFVISMESPCRHPPFNQFAGPCIHLISMVQPVPLQQYNVNVRIGSTIPLPPCTTVLVPAFTCTCFYYNSSQSAIPEGLSVAEAYDYYLI